MKQQYLLGLIGHPVSQSLSPVLHQAALAYCGLEGEYRAIDIAPKDLSAKFKELKESGFSGVNVTIPHKETVIPFLDEVNDDARAVGAVNTIAFAENGTTTGYNTDVIGFARSLEEALKRENIDREWSKSAIVLGCGGSARAVVAGLFEAGYYDVSIYGRNKQKSGEFVANLSSALGPKGALLVESKLLKAVDELDAETISGKSVVVNATPIGMNKEPLPTEFRNAMEKLDARAFVFDLVYSKDRTPTAFEQCANELGLASIDGLDMLIYQAAGAFEIWTGKTVPALCMKEGLRKSCAPNA